VFKFILVNQFNRKNIKASIEKIGHFHELSQADHYQELIKIGERIFFIGASCLRTIHLP